MSRYPSTLDSSIDIFLNYIRDDAGCTMSTVDFYRDQCRIVFKVLRTRREDILPCNLTEDDVRWYRGYLADSNKKISTQKDYLAALDRITRYYGNSCVQKTKTRMPSDTRPTVDWLSFEDAKRLLDHAKTPIQDIIIHLELCMGLRRCELARLRLQDISYNYITVTGKGPKGGKIRMVPYHPNTAKTVQRYLDYRQSLIKEANGRRRTKVEITDKLLVWRQGYKIKEYSEKSLSGISKIVDLLADELGMHFSNHTLRRTFGRILWKSGVRVETISKLLGHRDTATTLLYIGVNYDDMSEAMSEFNLR